MFCFLTSDCGAAAAVPSRHKLQAYSAFSRRYCGHECSSSRYESLDPGQEQTVFFFAAQRSNSNRFVDQKEVCSLLGTPRVWLA